MQGFLKILAFYSIHTSGLSPQASKFLGKADRFRWEDGGGARGDTPDLRSSVSRIKTITRGLQRELLGKAREGHRKRKG